MKTSVKIYAINYCEKFTLLILCMLAFSVSLGAAAVSISKALLLLTIIYQYSIEYKNISIISTIKYNNLFLWMVLALAWMLISMLWSIGSLHEQWKYFYGHSRIIWIAAIYFTLSTSERSKVVLKWLVFGQIFVIVISWLLWFGIEIPLTKISSGKGIAFTSKIEQPVMTTITIIILWNFRDYWGKKWGNFTVMIIISIMALNIVFLIDGRTGYLVFLTVVGIEIYRKLPSNWRWLAFFSPILLSIILFFVSSTFHDKTMEIKNNTEYYFNEGEKLNTSEGQRLDMWRHTATAIFKKPVLGYGVGSMPNVYKQEGGLIEGGVSQPHQQYLFWWVEFGLVGLLIMLSFFYILLIKSNELELNARTALLSSSYVLFVMGLANCPFFGVGMGEFFFLLIAVLLRMKKIFKYDSGSGVSA